MPVRNLRDAARVLDRRAAEQESERSREREESERVEFLAELRARLEKRQAIRAERIA